ncbi:hypothetical protein K435DRAFT_881526 [Dendrothele bispora CBS 962.96]|uniref:F-box domain-containing protein n=1 Tax=Dendrothele bispora (strain CBS 962.96) TaxID=1314807 RepID=A0A4S8KIA4_DENBC|nr:hypothetical protein K435DRAFT_881526 [Dendrothele bispora CBS 962.96]
MSEYLSINYHTFPVQMQSSTRKALVVELQLLASLPGFAKHAAPKPANPVYAHCTTFDMQNTLCTPELLRDIFKSSSRNDNIRNALVCKKWSDVSLDVVWHDVHMRDLPAFFNLLAPIKLGSGNSEDWTLNGCEEVWVQNDCWQYVSTQELG